MRLFQFINRIFGLNPFFGCYKPNFDIFFKKIWKIKIY